MSFPLIFCLVFAILAFAMLYCDKKFFILRDTTQAYKPFSWGRVQLAWWTVIILGAFITIFLYSGDIPRLDTSTVILLGISAVTTAAARVIDIDSPPPPPATPPPVPPKSNFVVDILSDEYNVNIHRFQTVAFNFVFGAYFISYVLHHYTSSDISSIMPVIENNNLVLLGLSSATYAALKTTENKTRDLTQQAAATGPAASGPQAATAPVAPDEEPAVG